MATCPECEFDEIDTEDFEEGDTLIAYAQIVCSAPPTCVVGTVPIELKRFYVLQTLHGAGVARGFSGSLGSNRVYLARMS